MLPGRITAAHAGIQRPGFQQERKPDSARFGRNSPFNPKPQTPNLNPAWQRPGPEALTPQLGLQVPLGALLAVSGGVEG